MPAVYQSALSHNVLVADGTWFFPECQGYNAMRLSFSHKPEVIEQGISVLGGLLKDDQASSPKPKHSIKQPQPTKTRADALGGAA